MREWQNPWVAPTKRPPFKLIAIIFGILLLVGVISCNIKQPTFKANVHSSLSVDPDRLKAHVVMLSETFHPRDYTHKENLNRCAEYIIDEFEKAGANPESQYFTISQGTYRNIIGRFGEGNGAKLIIGAHYDSCGDTPGADDNASGLAGLIELAHLFRKHPPNREIELVAYTLEEPPFYGTQKMGSVFHAKSMAEANEEVFGVIVLEMIGYFSDERGSQSFPIPALRLLYPGRGNFIGVIGKWDQGHWIKQIKIGMKGATDLPVYSIRAPADIPGIDFSDHRNYWPYGINALMISDTAFYRNRAYHSKSDTADRLDYEKMSQVVTAVFEAVQDLP